MDLVETLIENEIPGKRSMMGSIALTTDKIMFFGGISEQSVVSRDTCFIYDIANGTILKTAEIKLKERDAFPGDGYSYIEDNDCFVVAGRYYVHRLDKKSLHWTTIDVNPACTR